jgi:hypothetical protein
MSLLTRSSRTRTRALSYDSAHWGHELLYQVRVKSKYCVVHQKTAGPTDLTGQSFNLDRAQGLIGHDNTSIATVQVMETAIDETVILRP